MIQTLAARSVRLPGMEFAVRHLVIRARVRRAVLAIMFL